jgi:predicted helicase
VETLIYERIGAYMRKNLIKMYEDEERQLGLKMKALYDLYKSDLKKFNEVFGSEFKTEIVPKKSL